MTAIAELIRNNRSFRRFDESRSIERPELLEMIEAARLSASGRNAQPLKYYLSCDRDTNALIFPFLAWAGYLSDWPGPEPGEQPTGYIIQLLDTTISTNYFCDDGIAIQSILLTAVEKGLGGCIIGSVKKEGLLTALDLPRHLNILHVIALGKPAETVIIEKMKDNDIKYWRDEKGVHHVPKRSLEELVVRG